MALTLSQPVCAECGDRFTFHTGDCCGRCQRIVCRACSRMRGRTHESVLCHSCCGDQRPTGVRNTVVYRTWKRLLTG